MTAIATLTTPRLLLRGVTMEDVPDYSKYFVDYQVISQLAAAVPWPYPENGVRDFIENTILPRQGIDKWLWGIFLKDNQGELIGAIDLQREGVPEHRGFWLGHPFWGKGYMTEAAGAVMDHAFDHLGFETLLFSNALGNNRSRRVKEKTGARLLYTSPRKFVDPIYTEQEVWELTKAEWQAFRASQLTG